MKYSDIPQRIKSDLAAAWKKWDLGIIIILIFNCIFLQAHLFVVMKNEMAANRREDLLSKEMASRYWEIHRAKKIFREADGLRWKWETTKIQYATWAAITEAVWDFAPQFKLDPMKVMAIIERESYFDPEAISDAGARGLMQINFSVWKKNLNLDESKIHEIRYNIRHGMEIWRHYIDLCGGDESKALLMYWAGYFPPNDSYLRRIESSRFFPKEGGK